MRNPCKHPGCKSHVTHPCEGCGRRWGAQKEFNKYWRLGAELDDRFSMNEAIDIRREERQILLEMEQEELNRD